MHNYNPPEASAPWCLVSLALCFLELLVRRPVLPGCHCCLQFVCVRWLSWIASLRCTAFLTFSRSKVEFNYNFSESLPSKILTTSRSHISCYTFMFLYSRDSARVQRDNVLFSWLTRLLSLALSLMMFFSVTKIVKFLVTVALSAYITPVVCSTSLASSPRQ